MDMGPIVNGGGARRTRRQCECILHIRRQRRFKKRNRITESPHTKQKGSKAQPQLKKKLKQETNFHFHQPSATIQFTHRTVAMTSSRSKFVMFSASSTATVTYTYHNDHSAPQTTTEIPTPITDHHPQQLQFQSQAATKIQSAYKAHRIRTLYRKISSVNSEANHLQRVIQRQETVDCIRRDEREKLRMNEALMGLLLRLDSVPGIDPSIREARRMVSRRIVGLQEILDGICGSNFDDDFGEWGPYGYWKDLDKVVEQMEEEVCRERGGDEMERFCAQHLGFRCLQRFLRD